MRKIVMIAVMGVLLVLLVSSVATARTVIQCPNVAGTIICNGTEGRDTLNESAGADDIFGFGGRDRIRAGTFSGAADFVDSGRGADRVNTADGDRLDTVECSQGDRIRIDRGDDVDNKKACDRIIKE